MSELHDLLESLPHVDNPPPLAADAPAAVKYVSASRAEFVEPPLTVPALQASEAQVVVVSAPGAVGKSMLAEHLAYRTGGVLWDLGNFHVGDNFVVGTLAESHGPGVLGDVLAGLADSSFVIVADALDEARLRVTFDAFTAFLDDVATKIASNASAGHAPVVLLARGETAEFAAEWLAETGALVAHYGIDFFNRESSLEFIVKQIQHRTGQPPSQAMLAARDGMIAQLLKILRAEETGWDDARVGRFLGYAPVLVAIARDLAGGGNPYALAQDLATDDTPDVMWQFLFSLLDEILRREQDKFVNGLQTKVGQKAQEIRFTDWQELFTPREQTSWLLSLRGGGREPQVAVPPALEEDYRGAVREWLGQHPFVGASSSEFASQVFEDFVYAMALVRGSDEERSRCRALIAEPAYRPTEMFARFAFVLQRRAADEAVQIDVADFSAYYESLTSIDTPGQRATLLLSDDDGLVAVLETPSERVELALQRDGDEPIVFTRRLAHATLLLDDHNVRLGVGSATFDLGPDVSVRAKALQVAAASLVIRAPAEQYGGVVISADTVEAVDPGLQIRGVGSAHPALEFTAREPLSYPFTAYPISGPAVPPELGPAERAAARELFQLLARFKSEGYGGLGCYAEPIDRRAGKSPLFREVLAFAKDRGLITGGGKIYQLHTDVLQINNLQARAGVITPEVADFIRGFTDSSAGSTG